MSRILKLGRGKPRAAGWKHRAAGDAARDVRDWARAAAAYQAYITINPADVPILVQLGHVLKESGRFAEAETAYERAVKADRNHGDALLHLGALLNLNGERDRAAHFLQRSHTAGEPAASALLVAMGFQPQASMVETREVLRILVDAQAARDQRDGDRAAKLYRAYLDRRPNDPRARKQLAFIETGLSENRFTKD